MAIRAWTVTCSLLFGKKVESMGIPYLVLEDTSQPVTKTTFAHSPLDLATVQHFSIQELFDGTRACQPYSYSSADSAEVSPLKAMLGVGPYFYLKKIYQYLPT